MSEATATPEQPEEPERPEQMSHLEFLRAQFISAEPFSAKPPRKPRKQKAYFVALTKLALVLDGSDESTRRATVNWLADRFLGVRWYL